MKLAGDCFFFILRHHLCPVVLCGANSSFKQGLKRYNYNHGGTTLQLPLCFPFNNSSNWKQEGTCATVLKVIDMLQRENEFWLRLKLDGKHLIRILEDLQSYLSHLSLFLARESKKFYILVDNRPWLQDLASRPAHLWQLMVTKSRLSPFANTRRQKERKEIGGLFEVKASKLNRRKSRKFRTWFQVIDAASLSKKRALLPVKKLRTSLVLNSKLHRTLYGFIIFEVAWPDVRGINYLNELQSDTSLAIEAKFMKRWEFDSIAQASRCIPSWFEGTLTESFCLKEYLDSAIDDVFYDAQDFLLENKNIYDDEKIFTDSPPVEDDRPFSPSSSCSLYATTVNTRSDFSPQTPPLQDEPYKRRKLASSLSSEFDVDIYSEETENSPFGSPVHPQTPTASDCEEDLEATQYRDVLLLFRFNDRDLPFELKEIITSNLRLLTLLEAGLPSWAIFLQSYPVFCHLYRPWMCPLVRALYVLISIVTVLIGFYDLYKNVPVLKATASHLFGPLLDWIDTWEMVSRIKYLGTMLFLHNFRKAIEWFLLITRTIRSFLRIITQPVVGPLMLLWQLIVPFVDMFIQIAESLFTVIWIAVDSLFNLVENLSETVLLPFWFLLSVIWKFATSVLYPLLWILWEILYVPFRLVLGLCSLLGFIFSNAYELIGDIWVFMSSIFQFTSNANVAVSSSYEVSMWRTLWKDLFSQVFRAVRSILNGFVAFFAACNRHRLSIYNHILDFFRRMSRPPHRLPAIDSSPRIQKSGTRYLQESRENSPRQIKHLKQS